MNRLSGRGKRGAAANKPLIQILTDLGLTSNLRLCLDAGDINSWPGSGEKWLDTSGNGYDFYRGTSTSGDGAEPAFNGTPGGLSQNEYWSVDGGDYFLYDSTNETWMQNLHKDNARFTVLFAIYVPPTGTGSICGTINAAGTSNGFNLATVVTPGRMALSVGNDGDDFQNADLGTDLASSSWSIAAVEIDEPTGTSGGRWWFNGATDALFNCSYSTPTASNASQTFCILARGGGGTPSPSGTRLACFAMWEGAVIGETALNAIYPLLAPRFKLV